MLYMVTFTINIPPVLAYIPYMDPMGHTIPGTISRKIGQTIFLVPSSNRWKWNE